MSVANPMCMRGILRLSLPRTAEARVEIFDSAGHQVRRLLRGRLAAGRHVVVWDLRDDDGCAVSSGVYYCRLVSGGESCTAKLVYVR